MSQLLIVQLVDALQFTNQAIRAARPNFDPADSGTFYQFLENEDRGDGLAEIEYSVWEGEAHKEASPFPFYTPNGELPDGQRAFAPIVSPRSGRSVDLDPTTAKTKVLEYYERRGELPEPFAAELARRRAA